MKLVNLLMALGFFGVSVMAQAADRQSVWDQSLLNPSAQNVIRDLSQDYRERNTINAAYLNLFPADNRAETLQTRLGLENSRLRSKTLKVVDMLGSWPVQWSEKVSVSTPGLKDFHALIAIDTRNIKDEKAPVVLIFGSNTHNLQSFLSLGLMDKMSSWGMIPVAMEYPGYGGSFGIAGRSSWDKAGVGALEFLQSTFKRKIYVLGHSIGGAVAFDVASSRPDLVAGVIAHATFYSALEMAKDQVDFGWDLVNNVFNPIFTQLMASEHMFDNGPAIQVLAERKVPVYVLHGSQDGSVPVRHYAMLKDKMASEVRRTGFTGFKFQTFSSTHEDIFGTESYGQFTAIWDSVLRFMGK